MVPEGEEQYLVSVRNALPAMHEPTFQFEVAFADSYEALLARNVAYPTRDQVDVVSRALEDGRLMLAAEAGAGKSSVVVQAISCALDREIAAVRVDLRRWSPDVHDRWKALRESDTRRMALLLEGLADVPISERQLRTSRQTAAPWSLSTV